ncbi:glycosyltransferase [Dietzia sp. ANT_WB102]|nr:glycosyltransferase [Dietzia sp. ANT_WB102]
MLDRILEALRRQTGLDGFGAGGVGLAGVGPGADCFAPALRVIVADDGSPTPPVVPPEVTVVRQDDRGFRASAARHLGAQAGDGDLLLFLDGDTVPAPGYVVTLCAALAGNPDLLVVGRRRYGRFADTPPGAEPALEPEEILPDPTWPAAFYAETAGLTRGEDLWRGVLSAVCGLSRRLYDLAGGFDPDVVGYGGEDWELAWRCEQAGGRLRYVPDAVAWHDGPDWAGRAVCGDHSEATARLAAELARKNAESARLAGLIASPLTRPASGIFALPSIAVHVHAAGPAFTGTGSTAATCLSLLDWGDVSVTVDPATPDAAMIAELFADDPRVNLGGRSSSWQERAPGAGPRRRPPVLVDVLRPCTLGSLDPRRLRALCPPVGGVTLNDDEGRGLARIRSARAVAREQEWGEQPPGEASIPASDVGVRGAGGDGAGVRLEQVLGGW